MINLIILYPVIYRLNRYYTSIPHNNNHNKYNLTINTLYDISPNNIKNNEKLLNDVYNIILDFNKSLTYFLLNNNSKVITKDIYIYIFSMYKNIIKELVEYGYKNDDLIKLFDKNLKLDNHIEFNFNIDCDLYYKILDLISIINIENDENILHIISNIINLHNYINNINIDDKNIEIIFKNIIHSNDLIKDMKNILNIKTYKKYKKQTLIEKPIRKYMLKSKIKLLLKNYNKELNKNLKDIFKKYSKLDMIKDLKSKILYNNKILFNKFIQNIVINRYLIDKPGYNSLTNKIIDIDDISKSNIIIKILEEINGIECSNIYDKLNFNSPLSNMISNILNNNLDIESKQVLIEYAIINYENNYINMCLNYIEDDKNVDIKHYIFNKCVKNFKNKLELLVHPYIINNYKKLKNKYDYKSLIILTILYLGINNIINIIYLIIINLINNSELCYRNKLVLHISNEIINRVKYKRNVKIFNNNNLDEIKDRIINMDDIDKAGLGITLLDLFNKSVNILEQNIIKEDEKTYTLINIKKEFIDKLFIYSYNPFKLPLICKPKEWKNKQIGGYLTDELNYIINPKGIIHQNPKNLKESNIIKIQYNAINYLNQQKFKINKIMLNYLLSEWNKDNSIIFNNYNKLHKNTYKNNLNKKDKIDIQKHNNLYWHIRNILNIAILYKDFNIYIPVFMDFRGRIYPIVNYLSYQGLDLARSLLLFENETLINNNDIQYLYQYTANVYGLSKEKKENKIKWVNNNISDIINLFKNDRDEFNIKYLKNAKEPAQFMSCIFALMSYINGDKLIQIPILFDATCSGLQHLAGLCNNFELAKLVNLLDNDIQYDFYNIMGEYIKDIINIEIDKNLKDKLNCIKISRKLMKLPVMTIPYNISLEGLSKYVTENFEKIYENKKLYFKIPAEYTITDKELILTGSEMGIFNKIIYKALYKKIPSIKYLSDYFNNMININKLINQPLTWITPSGMKISQSNIKFKKVKVKANLLKNSKPITIYLPTKEFDYKEIKTSFMPNFIHSMDASNIHLLIDLLIYDKYYIQLYTIHDCFASTINNMKYIEKYVKLAFIKLYFEKDYLKEMHNILLKQINSYYPINTDENNNLYIVINNENIIIPKLPDNKWLLFKDRFIDNIIKSNYIIN